MKLYHLWMCPYCFRVRRTLKQLDIKCEKLWVGFHPGRWAEVERLTGKAMVPVLVDGDDVINESAVICDYLERKFRGGPPASTAEKDGGAPSLEKDERHSPN
ncbi:MAG: glutathione S-transferase N-terminal domain-containing protein [Candidatus Hydrogenedentota bacterium]|nr:MAG: glutathione S-transferase N-terminal domain-containing protein [Candidatus Hydrogenedentota bacterium]